MKTYQELKKEIWLEFEDQFLCKEHPADSSHQFSHELSGRLPQAFLDFLFSKLDEVASAALAAGSVESEDIEWIKNDCKSCKAWYEKNQCGSCGEIIGNAEGYNRAIAEIKRRSDEWLGKNN